MPSHPRSVVLIADDEAIKDAVDKAVAMAGGLSLDVHEGTLTSVNGAAVRFLSENDLVVFRLTGPDELEKVRHLRSQVGSAGMMLALSDRDISLSEARALKKSGVDEILPFPVAREELSQQIQRLATPSAMLPALYGRPAEAPLGQVIAVCPVRGGIGASTLTVNLADRLQDKSGGFRKAARNRVCVVDLDLQFGTVATELDLAPSPGLYKMASDKVRPDRTFLEQALVEHQSGLKVLTAPDEFIPLDAITREQVAGLIESLRNSFDYVVLDMPRTLVEWIGPVVAAADRILMVTDSTVPSIRQAHRLIEFFSQERLEPPVEMVVNLEKKPLFRASHHAEAEKVLGRKLRHWLPPDARHARLAIDRGQLLSQAAKGAPLAKAIRTLGRDLLRETQTQPGAAHAAE